MVAESEVLLHKSQMKSARDPSTPTFSPSTHLHVHYVVAVIGVLLDQVLEHLELHQRLMVEPLLVADNLDSVHPIGAEVVALEDLRMGKFGIGQVDV